LFIIQPEYALSLNGKRAHGESRFPVSYLLLEG
jgi:hypothetical protein